MKVYLVATTEQYAGDWVETADEDKCRVFANLVDAEAFAEEVRQDPIGFEVFIKEMDLR